MRSVLSHRDFRLLWFAQTATVLGDALILVALALYVNHLTGSTTDVGIVLFAYSAPLVILLLVGGVIADRLPRNAVMIATDVVRGCCHALLAVLIIADAVEIWHLIAIGVVFGSAEAFFRPAYTGLLPQTVPDRDLQPANALTGATREAAMLIGPALATALVLGVSAAAAFAIDAATFAVSALVLVRIHPRRRGRAVVRTTLACEMRDGWYAVRERAWVWVTIAVFSLTIFVALAPFFVLGPKVGEQLYGSSAAYGIFMAAWGAGTLCGALWGARWRPLRPMRAALLASIPFPVTLVLFGAGAPLGLVYPCATIAGVGGGLFAVWWETALAERIPPHLLSRVSAYDWMGSLALLPIGYLAAGPLGAWLGAPVVLCIGGAIGTLAMIAGCLPRETRQLRRLDGRLFTDTGSFIAIDQEPEPKSGRPASVVDASA